MEGLSRPLVGLFKEQPDDYYRKAWQRARSKLFPHSFDFSISRSQFQLSKGVVASIQQLHCSPVEFFEQEFSNTSMTVGFPQ